MNWIDYLLNAAKSCLIDIALIVSRLFVMLGVPAIGYLAMTKSAWYALLLFVCFPVVAFLMWDMDGGTL